MSELSATYGYRGQTREREGEGASAWSRSSVRLTVTVALLVCFGLVISVSAAGSDGFGAALQKRLALTVLGAGAFIVGATVDYRVWRRHHLGILIVALLCLTAVYVPGLGIAKNGARRWVNPGLPMGFQPSEFAKVALCIWLATYCARNLPRMRSFTTGFLTPMAVVGLTCALILWEPDFGAAALTGLVCLTVLVVMGTRLLFVLLAAGAALPLLQQLVFGVPYRMRRIVAFMDPWADPRGAGYQLVQSLIAVGSGGLTGRGLGAGLQKQRFLPGASNDFVFSVVAEELGFIGAVCLIGVFVFLLWELHRVIQRSPDPFAFALSLGLTVLLGVQSIAHIAVATGCVPTKGLSLPFISAGGSSLLASMLAAGIVVNIARRSESCSGDVPTRWEEEAPLYERAVVRVLGPAKEALEETLKSCGSGGG